MMDLSEAGLAVAADPHDTQETAVSFIRKVEIFASGYIEWVPYWIRVLIATVVCLF